MRRWAISATLLLAACSDSGTPASAYRHSSDRIWVALGLTGVFGHQACFRTVEGIAGRLPVAECYKLLPPQRMRGVWLTGFEVSSFFPGRDTAPSENDDSKLWLEVDRSTVPPLIGRKVGTRSGAPEAQVVVLDFIGRRTAVAGRYGHMGAAEHYVVVDRIISARAVDGYGAAGRPAVSDPAG